MHPDLAVLLATSGSTGDPKLVRLSRAAIEANTASIVEVLDIRPGAVTMTTLPFFYSYGMSMLNTYLHAGGTVIVTDQTLLDRGFWEDVDRYAVTSLALVPSHFQMLRRLRFDAARHPTLRTLTQAGGRMDPSLIVEVLSPTTRTHDLGRKLQDYQSLAAVQEIWLVDSERRWVQHWRREGDHWRVQDFVGSSSFASPTLDGEMPLDELYRNSGL